MRLRENAENAENAHPRAAAENAHPRAENAHPRALFCCSLRHHLGEIDQSEPNRCSSSQSCRWGRIQLVEQRAAGADGRNCWMVYSL